MKYYIFARRKKFTQVYGSKDNVRVVNENNAIITNEIVTISRKEDCRAPLVRNLQ